MAKKFIFEHRHEPLVSREKFFRRVVACFLFSLGLMSIAVVAGALGYHHWEQQDWMDAVLNAVMVMSGLGLQGPLLTSSGKLFTVFFSLLSALVFYSAMAISFTPVVHRLLHRFHLERENQ